MFAKLNLVIIATCLLTCTAPTSASPTPSTLSLLQIPQFPDIDQWINNHDPLKWLGVCTPLNLRIRKDFSTMSQQERKAYTSAIKCLRSKPSQLDQKLYPAATDRYMDYAVIHALRTKVVHLDGFFLTWHRYYLHLFEQDLRQTCGYQGAFPYWNWPATANDLTGSAVFNGDPYSMSGDGYPTNNDPIVLAPGFSIPHGSGGGCIKSGPFQGWTRTMNDISINVILQDLPLPDTAFHKNETCLTRDLNTYAAKTWTDTSAVTSAVQAPDMPSLTTALNGIFGGTALGIHSGAHFTIGSPASSLFVSPMDPIWYPLHTMLDRVYASWQSRHPSMASATYGTMTAANLPPSDNVTLSSVEPDWGYFQQGSIMVGELLSTTSGPFCYRYDSDL